MTAQETKLDAVANNIANANTTGYKKQDAEFQDLLYQTVRAPGPVGGGAIAPTGVQLGSGTRIAATSRSFSQGALQQTGNQLDLAVEGTGFLAVTRPNGELAYTRAGALKLDAQGRLVTSEGLPIEPPIAIPADATNITIGPDGVVSVTQPGSTTPNQVGVLQLTTFPNPAGLSALGHNLYVATAAAGDPQNGQPGQNGRGTLMQGALEGSNVEVVEEMIALIRTQRAYEINSKVIAAADEMLRNATTMR